jgi:hypothetical protein
MSRGYKRRQKLIKRGQWETPAERSARVFREFKDHLEKSIVEMMAIPPEVWAKINEEYGRK